jgi:calcineurin-like phosphoesterase family protein
MANTWFWSDLHLGHTWVSGLRGFDTVEKHDSHLLDTLFDTVGKKDRLWLLGDVVWSRGALDIFLNRTAEMNISIVLGNHDVRYENAFALSPHKVYGAIKQYGFMMTHIPIHPQEMHRVTGNIHGHIHKDAATKPLPLPYFNVNVDFHPAPVHLDEIRKTFADSTLLTL